MDSVNRKYFVDFACLFLSTRVCVRSARPNLCKVLTAWSILCRPESEFYWRQKQWFTTRCFPKKKKNPADFGGKRSHLYEVCKFPTLYRLLHLRYENLRHVTAVEFWGTWEVLVSSSLYSLYCSVLLLFYIDRWHGRLTDERALISSRSYEKQSRKRGDNAHFTRFMCKFQTTMEHGEHWLSSGLPTPHHPPPPHPPNKKDNIFTFLIIYCLHTFS